MSACGKCRSSRICNCSFASICAEDTTHFVAQAINFTGASGNWATTPDSFPLSITGTIELIAKIRPLDWTPSTNHTIIAKAGGAAGQRSYKFTLRTSGTLQFDYSTDGTNSNPVSSPVANAFINGTVHWVKVRFVPNDGAGNKSTSFFTSEDGLIWTPLGGTVTTAGTVAIFNSTWPTSVGASDTTGAGDMFVGDVYYAEIHRDTEVVGVFDPSKVVIISPQSPTTTTDSFENVWTASGGTWSWVPSELTVTDEVCTTLTGNGSTYSPFNYRPNNVPLPRPYALITKVNTQAVLNGASDPIIYNLDEMPPSFRGGVGMVNLVATPTRITAPIDGYYLVCSSFSHTGGLCEIAIQKNSFTPPVYIAKNAAMNAIGTLSVMTLVNLSAGDYLQTVVRNFSGGTVTIQVTGFGGLAQNPFPGLGTQYPLFWAQWVRPL